MAIPYEFENLEDYCLFAEKEAKVANERELTELRYQIFREWQESVGISLEDAAFIKGCNFDVDAFLSTEELSNAEKAVTEGLNQYRQNNNEKIEGKENYIEKICRTMKQKKGSKLSKKELKQMMEMQHRKEEEIYTAIIQADKKLVRLLESEFSQQFKDDTLDNEEYEEEKSDFLEERRTAESLTAIVMEEKKSLASRDEILKIAQDYITDGGKAAKAVLLTTEDEFLSKAAAYLEKDPKKVMLYVLFGIVFTNLAVMLIRYSVCIYRLDRKVLSTNIVYMIGMPVLSVATWILSTTQDYFNYYRRKWRLLLCMCVNISAVLIQPIYTLNWDYVIVNIFRIPTNELFPPSIVMVFGRISAAIAIILGGFTAYRFFEPFLSASEMKDKLLAFKLKHVVDDRENKEYKYDCVVVRDLEKGNIIPVKENDLFTHTLMIGASGTGKTSSVFLPHSIVTTEQKMKNLDLQQQEVLRMVKNGDVRISKAFPKGKFSKECFRVVDPKKQKEFDEIFRKYEDCGITMIAPNNSSNEKVLAYTSARGIWTYNLDPTKKKATHPYEILVGMNPFYMPERFSRIEIGDEDAEEERNIYIAEAANNFADTLTAINEMNGTGDQYFTDVNTTVTSAVATVLMLDASLRGDQITIDDVYSCIVDYDLLKPAVNNIKQEFHIEYKAGKNKQNNEDPNRKTNLNGMGDPDDANEAINTFHNERSNPYLQTIITVESRLQKGSKMDEHAEGLRNLLGKLLQDPQVKRVLVRNKNILDFNAILADNAITVVNTALNLGKNTSTCFGQLFLLSFNTAVLRRPKDKRSPHFLLEDETARYLSDTIDTMVTLYRQYRVACMFALQSLEQVDAVKKLAYLKNVLLSAGTIITFGRASYEDAKQISELSGQVKYLMEQNTASRTALTAENASSTFSTRTTPDQKNYLESNDIRARDFQECTIITTDGGRVMPGRLAKVNFVPKEIIETTCREQIERQRKWEQIWRFYSPLTEEKVRVTEESTRSSEKTIQTAEHLRSLISQSVTRETDDYEVQSFIASRHTKSEESLKYNLNTGNAQKQELTMAEMMKGVYAKYDEDEDEDMDYEDDDEYGIVMPAPARGISVKVQK